jgi:hypothetical protein
VLFRKEKKEALIEPRGGRLAVTKSKEEIMEDGSREGRNGPPRSEGDAVRTSCGVVSVVNRKKDVI